MEIKPILFNTEMVKAILDGSKTQTRRIIKPQLVFNDGEYGIPERCDDESYIFLLMPGGRVYDQQRIPPCVSGDVLWVRETWQYIEESDTDGFYIYAADHQDPSYMKWRPSIHMPKEAARIFLRVKEVWVEALQDLSEVNAIAEGVPFDYPMNPVYCPVCRGEGVIGTHHPDSLGHMDVDCTACVSPSKRFSNLWNSTIKADDLPVFGWDADPWVWVIEFERCEKPEGWCKK